MATWISIGAYIDLDPFEGDFESENSSALIGTIDHTEMSFVSATANDANSDGFIWEDDIGGGESVTVDGITTALDSVQAYSATVTLGDGSSFTTTLGVAQLANGEAYIIPTNETHLDNLSIQSIELTRVLEDAYDGMYATTAARSVDNSSLVCFASGTMIATPDGQCAVEFLKPGDHVMTLDHGPQMVRWTRSSEHPLEDVEEDAKPVRIKAGALGPGIPAQDLIISPQHRVLVGGAGQLDGLFISEAFAPAKSLTTLPGIRHLKGKKKITWIHFACDGHEVVIANGCYTESLLLGPMVWNGLNAAEKHKVAELFDGATVSDANLNGPPARECLKVGPVRRLIAEGPADKGRFPTKKDQSRNSDLVMEEEAVKRLVAPPLVQI
ncbi:MAG: Hint domain-containing protein [Pseudomonadota bacterium]